MDQSGERTLRAKYLDWCSARLAERFLDLSPEEIYELAQPEAGGAGGAGEAGAGRGELESASAVSLPPPLHESYRMLVQRVTESLLVRTPLPPFEQWAAAYEEAPARFDAELLGFWKDVAGEAGETGDAGEAGGSEPRAD